MRSTGSDLWTEGVRVEGFLLQYHPRRPGTTRSKRRLVLDKEGLQDPYVDPGGTSTVQKERKDYEKPRLNLKILGTWAHTPIPTGPTPGHGSEGSPRHVFSTVRHRIYTLPPVPLLGRNWK